MQRRIILLVVASILIVLVSLGLISHISIRKSIDHSLGNHLVLSTIIAENIEYILESNITRLHDISSSGQVDLADGDWEAEEKALRVAYEYSIFSDGLFMVDRYGDVLLTYPRKDGARVNLLSIPYVSDAISENATLISDVFTESVTQKKVIYALAPLRDRHGEVVGAIGGQINPASYMFTRIIKAVPAGENTCIEIVDSHGTIICSTDRKRILTQSDHKRFLGSLIAQGRSTVQACHRCHAEEDSAPPGGRDMIAFAPLSLAPWGIVVREPEEMIFAPATTLSKSYVVVGLVFVATGLILAMGLSKSIVRPIQLLNGATRKISDGNLEETIHIPRDDEIGALARGFDHMRTALAHSLDKIRRHNAELEHRVAERTNEVNRHRERLTSLLDEVIRAQEEERMRIARELHDETSQSIAALGMSLEVAAMALHERQLTPDMLYEQQDKARQLLQGINRIIQDLRPSVLDDLGFASAIRWLLQRHLGERGIKFYLSICDRLKDTAIPAMDKRTELRLFRIVQEAAINIAKYAEAAVVIVEMVCRGDNVHIDIIDDGVGFDTEKVLHSTEVGHSVGFGLLGMKERVEHLNGGMEIISTVGEGTQVSIVIPLRQREGA